MRENISSFVEVINRHQAIKPTLQIFAAFQGYETYCTQ